MSAVPESRAERKDRTRRAILDAALDLAGDSSLAAVSLRQVAKEAGVVPTAFYRHFASIEDLGNELVEESMESLRELLRTARELPEAAAIVDASVAALREHVAGNAAHFRFLARERVAGSPAIRAAIRRQLDLVTRDLATDLALLPASQAWHGDDLRTFAALLVAVMIGHAESLATATTARERDEIAEEARRQLRMTLVGAAHWRSD
ncbi:TetR family transcriptional regulator [Nocardioides sp.]|uniref:TetR family transcriptional regulator n=1 Tax=Nocardioides sp. TaxID=35761 RepID=UPI0039E4E8B1